MRVLILLTVLAMVGCASQRILNTEVTDSKPTLSASEEERWTLMVGKWYGSQPTKGGGLKQHIAERYPDGSYKITFKITDARGNSKKSSEVGNWGISGPIYFTIFRGWLNQERIKPSDPSSPYNYDAYNIINLTSEVFEYNHVTTGNRYKIQKVESNFVFPH